MINVGPSYEYTFNVDNNTISSSSYSVYYIPDYIDMEVTVRYQDTETSKEKTTENRTKGKED